MSKSTTFKEDLQVNCDNILDVDKIINTVDLGLQKYTGKQRDKANRNIFKSGEMLTYDALLSAGLLFKLYETCGKTIDAHIITRVKSQNSIEEKKQRQNRPNKENLGDIIGSSLIIDKVHNYTEIVNIFKSGEIQTRYNERQSNIILLNEVAQFILDLNSDEHNIASDLDDRFSKNNNELVARLNISKKDCKNIMKNCNSYFKESKTNKTTKFPIHRTLKSMCRELIQEEIQKAFYSIDSNLKQEIENKKIIEEELVQLQQFGDESEEPKITNLQSLLSVQEKKIETLKQQIELLRENINNKDIVKLKILLSNCLNNERIELLEEIEKHISAQIDRGEDINANSIEKKYCQYLIIVLYQIKKLEYINPKDNFKGKIYETVEHSLYSQLKEYRDAEIEGNRYRNMTFDDIQKLTTNLRRLDSRLSDKLEHEILDYSMQLYLNDVIKQFTGEYPSEPDFKIKQNGYVATHLDIDMIKTTISYEEYQKMIKLQKELKLVTHHRDLQSTTGTAAYGSGRQENMEAKKRKNELLETSAEQKYIKFLTGPKIKEGRLKGITSEQIDRAREKNYFVNFILSKSEALNTNLTEALKQKMHWQRELFSIIPKYSTLHYNQENDTVEINFFSDYENVKKYYTETNLPVKRTQVTNTLDNLRERKMISDRARTLVITHEQYRYFMRNQLEDLRGTIINQYIEQTRDNVEKNEPSSENKDIED